MHSMSETPPVVKSPNTASRTILIEDHDGAYYAWKERGIRTATLVHIDAHIDLAWFNASSPADLLKVKSMSELDNLIRSVPEWNPSPNQRDFKPNIGNYICSAMWDGIVEKMYWVVPDDFLNSNKKIRSWVKRLKAIVDDVPGEKATVRVIKGAIITSFSGKEVVVCALVSMPSITEPVILDIDTDFFVTPFEANTQPALLYLKKKAPWIWPDELAGILQKKNIKPIISTIAYSVEGYYTPINYKFLGDYLRLILDETENKSLSMRAMVFLKKAAMCESEGKEAEALALLKNAAELLPDYAGTYFNMARLQYEEGSMDEARRSYRRAVEIDSTYRTGYNNAGDIFRGLGMFDRMDREYSRILALDPDSVFIHISVGDGLLARGKYEEAGKAFTKATALDPRAVKAQYMLAKVCYFQNRYEDAHLLLDTIIMEAPAHFGARVLLGEIALKRRRYKEALEHYKMLLRFRYGDPGFYTTLSMLFLLNGKMQKSLKYLWRSIVLQPVAVKECLISSWRWAVFKRKAGKYVRA